MNNLRNSVRLIGNLGMNPEVKEIGKDKKVAKFRKIVACQCWRF
jgi:single-stranded DNA-binding protein